MPWDGFVEFLSMVLLAFRNVPNVRSHIPGLLMAQGTRCVRRHLFQNEGAETDFCLEAAGDPTGRFQPWGGLGSNTVDSVANGTLATKKSLTSGNGFGVHGDFGGAGNFLVFSVVRLLGQ